MIPEMYICSFLSANTNKSTNVFEKNKKIQIRIKILPKNVFENTKSNTFQIQILFKYKSVDDSRNKHRNTEILLIDSY